MTTELPLLLALDLSGTFVFALNGALTAVHAARLDIVGVLTLGMITALGGCIIRDVLIGSVPPAAFHDWRYLALAAGGGLVAFALSQWLNLWVPNWSSRRGAANNTHADSACPDRRPAPMIAAPLVTCTYTVWRRWQSLAVCGHPSGQFADSQRSTKQLNRPSWTVLSCLRVVPNGLAWSSHPAQPYIRTP